MPQGLLDGPSLLLYDASCSIPRREGRMATPTQEALTPGPLKGLRVLDAASLFAGPVIATLLGDFGADVIKIEHPRGDGQRYMGWQKEGNCLWWTFLGRNKRSVTLDFHKETGQKVLKELVQNADVLIENFRPGTFESWGLGYEDLAAINPHLVMVRVTGFGQTGPYRTRPGFGTLAEAMSGFAHINGHPDGPPTLPPFALGDAVAGLFGTSATMFALHYRDRQPDRPGQYIDLSIYEPLFWILGPQASVYDQLGVIQGRTGNRAPFTSPRNAYKSKDDKWIALSGSTQSTAERVMKMVGAEYIITEDWFRNHEGRLAHQDLLDDLIGKWVAERTAKEVIETADDAEVAMFPVYTIADIFTDPQYLARETITSVDDPRLGPVRLQNVVPKLSRTPGSIRHLGPGLGEHNRDIFLGELGHSEEELLQWSKEGVI
jgi:formyl-CoA transferase